MLALVRVTIRWPFESSGWRRIHSGEPGSGSVSRKASTKIRPAPLLLLSTMTAAVPAAARRYGRLDPCHSANSPSFEASLDECVQVLATDQYPPADPNYGQRPGQSQG